MFCIIILKFSNLHKYRCVRYLNTPIKTIPPNWFILSNILLSALVPFLWWFQLVGMFPIHTCIMGWWSGSSGRASAYQLWDPVFKLSTDKKKLISLVLYLLLWLVECKTLSATINKFRENSTYKQNLRATHYWDSLY
jgi:hypothetical protein